MLLRERNFNRENKDSAGNAMLELVLFTPLALFFLFISIDCGLSLIQRAGIQDAFRSGIGSLPLFAKQDGATAITADRVADEIFNNLNNIYSMYSGSQNNYYVNTSLYEVNIDPQSGSFESYNIISNKELGSFSEGNTLRSFATKSGFISTKLVATSGLSKYADPAALIQFNNRDSQQVYKNKSYLLYAEIKAIPVGINTNFLSSTLGGVYSLQVQQLELIRDY